MGAGLLDEAFEDEVEELVGFAPKAVCRRGTLPCPACACNPTPKALAEFATAVCIAATRF